MQTRFTAEQLRDPDVAESEQILRKCVHCGFCTATCPTYVLLGDELDSPRGRIYLVKDMLESGRPASAAEARHVDRCLSCLACMTTCPSGVHYQHLIDHARAHVERTFRRPPAERLLRAMLAAALPSTGRFRALVRLAASLKPFARVLPARLAAMVELAPRRLPRPTMSLADGARFGTERGRRARVALLAGCVQPALAPHINEATVRLLTRAGAEVVVVGGCCGAIVHHMGRDGAGRELAAALLRRTRREETRGGFDAVVANASGCGTHLKDYGFLFRNDDSSADAAAALARRARDVTEVLAELGLPEPAEPPRWTIAYHSACSMQHGQRLHTLPRELLERAGFTVREVPEGHLCCGSAGTYNVLQPELARALRDRKAGNIATLDVRAVATGNLGCIAQLAPALGVPIVHTVELLDWATGGPRPASLGRAAE